jgi:polyhydroxybutyrate depolymerase
MTQKISASLLFCFVSFLACSADSQSGFSPTKEEETIEKADKGTQIVRSSGLETNSISVNQTIRTYLTYSPSVTSGLIPVIIDFHGGAGTAEEQYITSNFIEIADREGILVVYPQADVRAGSVWNTLHSDEGNKVAGVDDFGFIAAIIESLDLNPTIDTSRIYVSGYSNGAAMAYQIACHLNDDIAGFVVMSGLFPLEAEYPCVITHETAGIIINGTSDYERPMTGIEGYALPVRQAASWWAIQNESTQETIIQDENIERTTYETEAGTQIQLFIVEGGGHDWFTFYVDDMPMNEFIWEFLSNFRN